MAESENVEGPVLHVVVVGFHHKKGCQVEYSYPPTVPGNPVESSELPPLWKHLPSLALPDGSHNFQEDTVFFHLPSLDAKCRRTLFGISCYRQMDAKDLRKRGADVTRNTVQKSVCVISKLPLYGLIQAKLELITHAYFDERDFSEVTLLQDTYRNLNASLNASLLHGSQAFLGISCRDLVATFKHKVIILFKLMMLERRVLFFGAPVKPICSTLLAVLSLFPGMIEYGLMESSSYNCKLQVSPTLKVTRVSDNEPEGEEFLEIRFKDTSDGTEDKNTTLSSSAKTNQKTPASPSIKDKKAKNRMNLECKMEQVASTHVESSPHKSPKTSKDKSKRGSRSSVSTVESDESLSVQEQQLLDSDEHTSFEEDKLLLEINEILEQPAPGGAATVNGDLPRVHRSCSVDAEDVANANVMLDEENIEVGTELCEDSAGQRSPSMPRSDSVDSDKSASSNIGTKAIQLKNKLSSALTGWQEKEEKNRYDLEDIRPISPTELASDDQGFPIAIFTKGMLCHPYLSLQYYDILQDVNVRGFAVGATNVLFKQKRHLLDAVIEVGDGKIEIFDAELRRQVNPSTADLRFADFLVKYVTDDKGDIFLDDTGWEGGDEWLRAQFKHYLQSILATSKKNDEKLLEDFNISFIQALRTTHNYKQWRCSNHEGMDSVTPGHPFQGQLSVADMKIKLSHTMQNTERGKKINAAVVQTGKVVAQTGKVVGGALTSAKSAVSSWFSSFTAGGAAKSEEQKEEEEGQKCESEEKEDMLPADIDVNTEPDL